MNIKHIKSGIKYKLTRIWIRVFVMPLNGIRWKRWDEKPQVIGGLESLEMLVKRNCSICRFGDGEFELIWGKDLGFQKYSTEIATRLNEVLHSKNPNILIGLPNIFGDMTELALSTAKWWREYRLYNLSKLQKTLNGVTKTVDANITRFTTEMPPGSAEKYISLYKKIWENRKVTIVEGEKSRLGVGNDLFKNTKSIHRIIAPAKDAFSLYDILLNNCKNLIPLDNVVIIALGPTATILAYDLALAGYQALDLGHIDIQYEYYKRNVREKIAIPGKYVNEGGIVGQNPDDSIIDENYIKSILINIS